MTTWAKLRSLPPMPSVTTVVAGLSAFSSGGFVPRMTDWDASMFAVVAPEQLTSVNEDAPIAAATSDGELWLDRRQSAGDPCWSGMSGPAVKESPSET